MLGTDIGDIQSTIEAILTIWVLFLMLYRSASATEHLIRSSLNLGTSSVHAAVYILKAGVPGLQKAKKP